MEHVAVLCFVKVIMFHNCNSRIKSFGARLTNPARTPSLAHRYRCAVPRLGPAKRESGEIGRTLRRIDPGAAPATVSGEPSSTMPLGFPREGGARAATREPGDLPAPVTLPMHGACTRGGFRSGDVLKPSRGIWGASFSQQPDKGAHPAPPRHVQPIRGHVMSIHLRHTHLLRSGLAAGALLAALGGVANAQTDPSARAARHLAEPRADRSLEDRLVRHRDERRGNRARAASRSSPT